MLELELELELGLEHKNWNKSGKILEVELEKRPAQSV